MRQILSVWALLALGWPIPASAESVQSEQSIALFVQHCLSRESVSTKLRALNAAGWSEPFGGAEEMQNHHILVHDSRPQIITITSPTGDTEVVRDCIVDGKGIDARKLADAAIDMWGIPKNGPPGLAYWSVGSTEDSVIILANSQILDRDQQIPLFALAMRNGLPASGTE